MWLDLAVGLPTKAGRGRPSLSWDLRLFARAYRKAFRTLFWRYLNESLSSGWGVPHSDMRLKDRSPLLQSGMNLSVKSYVYTYPFKKSLLTILGKVRALTQIRTSWVG